MAGNVKKIDIRDIKVYYCIRRKTLVSDRECEVCDASCNVSLQRYIVPMDDVENE